MSPMMQAVVTILLGVGGCVGYFWLANLMLDRLLPARGPRAGANITRANLIRPWLFVLPAVAALGLYLAWPVVETLRLSLTDRDAGGAWVGGANYARMWNEPKFHEALRNNMLWLLIVPGASTALGLLAAQLTDRIRWGNVAKSLIFMPMAISFVGAAVIWKLVYDARPADQPQIGALNALWLAFEGGPGSVIALQWMPAALLVVAALGLIWVGVALVRAGRLAAGLPLAAGLGGLWLAAAILGADPAWGVPQTWLTLPFWNNLFLMAVLVWIQTGFAMVILSAALRGIPEETIEAAVVDGAGPLQIFFRIKVPQILPTIVVVWTTITLVVLKVFDIVFAMTNGQWETQVLANYMYDKMFRANDWGVGSAAAMVIMLLVLPILVWNVASARAEMRR